MSIILNDNIEAKAPKPLDKYEGPWESVNAALTGVPINVRFKGRTVKILENGLAVEYWWADGVNLTKKSITNKFDTEITVNGAVQSKYPYGIIVNYDQNRNPKLSYNSKVVAVADTLSEYGVSLKLPAGSTDPGVRPWYGPYVALENGNYNWTVYNRISDNTKPGSLLYVDINETGGTAPRGTIASKVVKYSDFSADSTIWLATVLNFTARKGYNYEARIDIARDTVQPYPTLVDIWLDYGVLSPFTASAGHSADEYLKTTFYTTQTSNFNLVNAMAGTTVRCNATGNITATLNDSNQFAIGDKITIRMSGTGGVTLAAGPDITLNAPQGLVLSRTYSYLEIVKQAANVYSVTIMGDDPTKVDIGTAQNITGIKTFLDNPAIRAVQPKVTLQTTLEGYTATINRMSLNNTWYVDNMALAAGGQGKNIILNGSTYAASSTTSLPMGNSPFTVGVWYKASSTGLAMCPVSWGDLNLFFATNGSITLRTTSTGTSLGGSALGTISTKTWNLATITYDGTSVRVYHGKNSSALTQSGNTTTATINNIGSTLTVGKMNAGGTSTFFYTGELDHLFFYARALSLEDIQKIYNDGMGNASIQALDLKSLYKFDEGTGALAANSVAGGTTLTFNTAPIWSINGRVATDGTLSTIRGLLIQDGLTNGDRGIINLGDPENPYSHVRLIGQFVNAKINGYNVFTIDAGRHVTIDPNYIDNRDGNNNVQTSANLLIGTSNVPNLSQLQLSQDTVDMVPSASLLGGMKFGADGRIQLVNAATTLNKLAYLSDTSVAVKAISTKNANYTLNATDYTILADASIGTIILTLPPAATVAGRIYKFKKKDNSTNTVTIDGNVNETIDGQPTQILSSQNSTLEVHCDGSAWYIV